MVMKSQTIGPCSFGPQLNNFGLAMIQRKKYVENFLSSRLNFSDFIKIIIRLITLIETSINSPEMWTTNET